MRSPPANVHPRPRRRAQSAAGNRGSVLIVALLLAAIIALALGSFLNLNLTSSRMAKRTFNSYAALNLAEAGAEEAVWSFNRATDGEADAWTGWSNNGTAAWQKFAFDLGNNHRGWAKVYVDNYQPGANARPKVIAQSGAGNAADTESLKMIEVTLRRRAYFADGLVGRDSVVFSGSNASVDSWNSDPDNDPATSPVEYTTTVRRDRGTVASVAVLNTAVLVNNADIWGYVATGGGQPEVGAQGSIRGADTPENVTIDSRRVTTDFSADFIPVSAPVDGTPLLTVGSTLGTEGAATKWRTTAISLSGSQTLTILGDVTLVLTAGSGVDAISISGRAALIIPEGSSLTVYTEGNVRISGQGLGNSNVQPISCQFWGTNASATGQEFDIVGKGALRCVLYAPNGDVTVRGNGDVMGSIVARTIKLTGNAAFHYDEALAQRESNEPFTISKWRELTTATEQAPYTQYFRDW